MRASIILVHEGMARARQEAEEGPASSSSNTVPEDDRPAIPFASDTSPNVSVSLVEEAERLKQWEDRVARLEGEVNQRLRNLDRESDFQASLHAESLERAGLNQAKEARELEQKYSAKLTKEREEALARHEKYTAEIKKEKEERASRVLQIISASETAVRQAALVNAGSWALELKDERWRLTSNEVVQGVPRRRRMEDGKVEFLLWRRPGVDSNYNSTCIMNIC